MRRGTHAASTNPIILCFNYIVTLAKIYRLNYHLCHVIDHFICHSRIYSNPEGVIHDVVCCFKCASNSIGISSSYLIKCRMPTQISRKPQSCLSIMLLYIFCYLVSLHHSGYYYKNLTHFQKSF